MADNERITLGARYEIINKIGGGGMAEVFHGYDTFLNRDVAIKILRDQYIENDTFIKNFRQEACSAASLLHPNIVSVYDVGTDNSIYYIVMEYVNGSTLKKYIMEHGAVEPKKAIGIAKGIAAALIQAHIHNIVHCDIKSHNILLTTEGIAKVTDFGIAKVTTQATTTLDKVVGSVYYLSPEQACGKPVTPRSDLYSLGVVLFEMLTGKLPFEADTPLDVALMHVQQTVPSLHAIKQDIPMFLEQIVDKALAKKPEDRYNSAQELLIDLKKAEVLLKSKEDNAVAKEEVKTTHPDYSEEGFNDATVVINKADMLANLQEANVQDNNLTQGKEELAVQSPIESNRDKKMLKRIFLVIVAMLAIAGISFGLLTVTKPVVVIPELKGKTIVEAENILTQLKLNYKLQEEYNAEVISGQVCRTIPGANSQVREGRTILLVISKGVEPGKMPYLRGKTLSEAKTLLSKAKIKLGNVTVKYKAGAKADEVLEQSIASDTQVADDVQVDLVVNSGDKDAIVPDLSGVKLEDVKAKLADAGLTIGEITEEENEAAAKTVLRTSPSVGAVVRKGTAVTIVVSKGGKGQDNKGSSDAVSGNIKIVEFVVPSGAANNNVRIVVANDNGTSTVYTGSVKSGARIRQQVNVAGPTRVQFYVNSSLQEEKKL